LHCASFKGALEVTGLADVASEKDKSGASPTISDENLIILIPIYVIALKR
jgi:hypothetical protein